MAVQQRFPKIAALILIAGLIAVTAVVSLSYTLNLYPARSVTTIEQARAKIRN